MEKQVTVTVEDTGGKKWKLTRQDGGVKIVAPVSFKTNPIPLDTLRQALDELSDNGSAPR